MRQNKGRSQYFFNIPFSFHSFGLTFVSKDSAFNALQNHERNESNRDTNKALIVVILITSIDINFQRTCIQINLRFFASETLVESFKAILSDAMMSALYNEASEKRFQLKNIDKASSFWSTSVPLVYFGFLFESSR